METEPAPGTDAAPRRRRPLWRIGQIVGITATLAATGYASYLTGREELFLACLLGTTPILLALGIRWVRDRRRGIQTRRFPLAVLVTALIAVALVGATFGLFASSHYLSRPPDQGPPGGVALPVSLSAEYTGIGRVTDTGIEVDEEIVVGAASFDEVRRDVLARLKRMDRTEHARVFRGCTGDEQRIPATWRIPVGTTLPSDATSVVNPNDYYPILVENVDECFSPDRLSTKDWTATRRLGNGVVYQRSRFVPLETGAVYSVTEISMNLSYFSFPTGLGTDQDDIRRVFYPLEMASSSTLELTAPGDSIAAIHPATTVIGGPAGDDTARLSLNRRTDGVEVTVLSGPFRNQAGMAVYEALRWGPLEWVLGGVGLIASWFLSDLGISLVKRSVRAMARLFLRRRSPDVAT